MIRLMKSSKDHLQSFFCLRLRLLGKNDAKSLFSYSPHVNVLDDEFRLRAQT